MNAPRPHPTAALDHLLDGTCDRLERQAVIRHLLAGCAECSRQASRKLRVSHQPRPAEAELDNIFDRLIEQSGELVEQVGHDQAEAETLLANIASLPVGRRALVLQNSSKFRRRAVCDRLIESSVALRREDPAGALHQAELAVAIARRLEEPGSQDVLARALLEEANGRRITDDFRSAEAVFGEAALTIERSACDPQLQAELLFLLASLRADQRRSQEALDLLAEADRLYRRLGDTPASARCLIKRSLCLMEMEQLEPAMVATWTALNQLGCAADLQDLLPGIHNLILQVSRSGAVAEAMALLETAQPIYRVAAGETDILRLQWLQARLLKQLGDLEASEESLGQLKERFADLGLPYDAALVSLDLAEVLVLQERVSDLQSLACEMLSVFSTLAIGPEALASLAMLRQSVALGTDTVVQIGRIAAEVEKHGRRPTGLAN